MVKAFAGSHRTINDNQTIIDGLYEVGLYGPGPIALSPQRQSHDIATTPSVSAVCPPLYPTTQSVFYILTLKELARTCPTAA